jgi:multidrug efflux system membrane fusion protein
VQNGPNGGYAYVIKPDNTVERRDVDVASIQDGIAVVTKGLAAGERVVVDGQYRLTNGARVIPREPSASSGAAG